MGVHRGESQEDGRLTELRRQRSKVESLSQLEDAGQGSGEERFIEKRALEIY